ncbi:Gfo/Idh/MocA family protein [Lentzea albidocapillata]|uniref:Oxidoreductase family, NAD-binding Rossmann fold n=1 Tax=Lentzea albidocapillata TaxID=40571 RepID=A0A1W2F8V3_9PSEU|nr:Gfo/Idh/MocA family oxidoreductase [Lentzea albidocapillata]SMD18350.1 Oxidoreductase family, NAD-binding Rossmann fold [Lentzea albidocapillata]
MRFGLIGTGFWANFTHAPALASTPGSTLDAVWGRNPDAAAELAAAHGAVAFTDFDAFLDAVDAVAFAVSPRAQPSLAIRAAQAGKHLLLEKPIALTPEDADALVSAIDDAGVASVVFFTWRFNPDIRAWLAEKQEPGGGWAGGAALWLATALRPGSPFNTPWRQETGALWDVGPHLVDMLGACLGPVTSVTAVPGGGEVSYLVLQHVTGASSTATMTLSAPKPASGPDLFLWGPSGRSTMPVSSVDPRQSLRVAAAELAAVAALRRRTHPCDARSAKDTVQILAEAEKQLRSSMAGI